MYDDLITAIRKTACRFKECGMCPKGKEPCIDRYALQAADAIEELFGKVEQLPCWIPVTERLPEKFDSVLVVYVGFNDHIPRANMLAYIDSDGDWCWWDDDIPSGIPCAVEITHWMPLPEPPKEETNAL